MSWEFSSSMSYNKREFPVDIDDLMNILSNYQPENEYQALMESAPFQEPVRHKSLINEAQDIVLDCLEVLLDQDKFIIQAINYEQVSYEVLGQRLGVSATHAWRLKQIAYKHLEEVLTIDGRISKILKYE
jgi:DNA-directed RNA polymerase specialized sigma24 family protein